MADDSTTAIADGEEAAEAGLRRVVLAAWPLLLSILLLMSGSGLQGSLLGVRAAAASFNPTVIGVVLGLYYLGYVAGSAWVPGLIRSVGHIRVFASLASLASAAVVVHGVWVSPLPWIVLRFVTGVCVAGLFVVSESWLNALSTSRTRATLLAVYNTVVTAGLAFGGLLLNVADTNTVMLFVVGSVLLSIAAVPIALAPHEAPRPQATASISIRDVFKAAPLGLAGSAISGLGTGAALGFGAVYAIRAGFGVSGASQFVVAVLAGAVLGQIPLGRWSDRTDRRYVMGTASALVLAGALVGIGATSLNSFPGALLAAFLLGAGAFSLYGLSFAHLVDYIDPGTVLAAGTWVITCNGLGAASGPFLASLALSWFGPDGFFHLLAVASLCFCVYVVMRIFHREAVSDDQRAIYVAVASPTIAALDDVISEVAGVEPEVLRRRRLRRPMPRRKSRDHSRS